MASGSFISACPQFFARSVYSSCIYIPHPLPCKPCSPSDFRQALPANDADGEAPSKVVWLRGERMLWETCRRQEGKKKSRQKEISLLSAPRRKKKSRADVMGDVSAPRRNSQCMCHRVCESLCESFVAPSAFRQALPANGADGEASLTVVGAARRAGGPN